MAKLIIAKIMFEPTIIRTLIKNCPFCNYVFNYYSTINQVENYTYSCNLFFAIAN
jgi:hypothetical protein